MRTMKKTIAFVLAFAMTFATAFSAVGRGVTASAAESEETNFAVKVNADGSFVAVGVNEELQVGVVKINKKSVATIKSWDTYESKQLIVKGTDKFAVLDAAEDGSNLYDGATGYITLTPKKDMVVAFRTVATKQVEEEEGAPQKVDAAAYTKPIFWEIQANATKYKAKIAINKDADSAEITVNNEATGFSAVSATLGGSALVGETNVINKELYNIGGAIQVTPLGESDASKLSVKNKKFTYLDDDEAKVEDTNVVQANAKTINVKLKKRANGPKVAINYAKGTVTIPKDTEYTIVDNGGTAHIWTTFTSNSSKEVKTLPAVDEGVVRIKKAATDKALASKVGVATFAKNTTAVGDLEFDYDAEKGLTVNNKYAGVVEYYIGTSAPDDKTKWSKYKKDASVTTPAKKVKADATIYYRRAGIAAECKTPGDVKSFVIASKIPVDVLEYDPKNVQKDESLKGLYKQTASGTYVKCGDSDKAEEAGTYYEAKTYTYTPVEIDEEVETIGANWFEKDGTGFKKATQGDPIVEGKIYYTKAEKK